MFRNTAAVLSCAWTADAPTRFMDVIKNECISLKLKSMQWHQWITSFRLYFELVMYEKELYLAALLFICHGICACIVGREKTDERGEVNELQLGS